MKSFNELEDNIIPEPRMQQNKGTILDYKYPIDKSIYWNFITYASLDKIISTEFKDSKADKINVYIDLYQIMVSICKFTVIKNAYSISSAIINYCANIRRYFKKIGVYANIVLVFTDNSSDNITQFIPEFGSFYKRRIEANKRVRRIILTNIELLKKLVPYLPNIYIRIGTVDTSVIIHDIIRRKMIGIAPSVVFSSSVYMMQLPLISKSVKVIHKHISSKNNEDQTYCFNKNNCFQAFIYKTKKVNMLGNFNQNTLHIIMAIVGSANLGVNSLGYNYESAIEFCNMIPYGYEHDFDVIESTYEKFVDKHYRLRRKRKNGTLVTPETLINRIKGMDIMYQYSLYKLLPEYNELDFLNQYTDKESVHEINNTYYKDCEMNLEDL